MQASLVADTMSCGCYPFPTSGTTRRLRGRIRICVMQFFRAVGLWRHLQVMEVVTKKTKKRPKKSYTDIPASLCEGV